LKEICQKCPTSVLAKIGDVNAFVDLTANTRNYWTHFDERTKTRAATDIRLVELDNKLRMILISILLQEMGVKNEEIDKVFAKPWVNF
jgi:hypothetical protein